MKIAVLIRTYNEESRIEKCCLAYQFADMILVADGGSTDKTVEIAKRQSKTFVRDYPWKVECANGIFRNPDGPHLNFLYEWGISEGADWIISQDCDQRPNKYLKEDARIILEGMTTDYLLATQIFLWGSECYFPYLSRSGNDNWWQGLWAWRSTLNLKAIDHMPHYEFSLDGINAIDINKQDVTRVLPPYCFMHFGWETEEKADAQVEYYRRSKLISTIRHPLDYGGPLLPLESWMIEN